MSDTTKAQPNLRSAGSRKDGQIHIEVTSASIEGKPVRRRIPGVAQALAPESVTKVKSAFMTASGRDWPVVIDGWAEIQVDGDNWVNETVAIPGSACPP